MLKIRWDHHITNEVVLQRIGERRNIWETLTKRRDRLVGHILRHPGIVGLMMEGMVEGANGRGRPSLQYIKQIAGVCQIRGGEEAHATVRILESSFKPVRRPMTRKKKKDYNKNVECIT